MKVWIAGANKTGKAGDLNARASHGPSVTTIVSSIVVPSPSNKYYRDCNYKTNEMTGVYHTILKFSEQLGHDIDLTEQVPATQSLPTGTSARSSR